MTIMESIVFLSGMFIKLFFNIVWIALAWISTPDISILPSLTTSIASKATGDKLVAMEGVMK